MQRLSLSMNIAKKAILGLLLLFMGTSLGVGALEILLYVSGSVQSSIKFVVMPSLARLRAAGLPEKYLPRGTTDTRKRFLPDMNTPWPLLMASSPAYDGYSWADAFWQAELEYYRLLQKEPGEQFQPNVIWRSRPRKSEYVNVSKDGVRHTWNPVSSERDDDINIAFFGASTAFGTGVPDNYTIPSLLSKHLNGGEHDLHTTEKASQSRFHIANYGTGSYVLQQDVQLFLDLIRESKSPDIAVFYHGSNDSYAAVYSPGIPGWYLGSEGIEKRLMQPSLGSQRGGLNQFDVLNLILSDHGSYSIRSVRQQPFLDDYSERIKTFLDYYRAATQLVSDICEVHQIDCYFIWQPSLLFGAKPKSEFESAMYSSPALLDIAGLNYRNGVYQQRALSATYESVQKVSNDYYKFYNLSRIFDSITETVFIDYVHLGPHGNELVAESIANIINANGGSTSAGMNRMDKSSDL